MRVHPKLQSQARELRRSMTPAEVILWRKLRNRRFDNFKFRRQHVIGGFIVDFYCLQASIVIELDGETHLGKECLDETRLAIIEKHDVKVLRFWNHQIYEDLDAVLEYVWQECRRRVK